MPNKLPQEGQRDIQKVIAALASPIRREIPSLIWAEELPAGQIAAAFPAWNSYSYGQGQSSTEASIGFVALE